MCESCSPICYRRFILHVLLLCFTSGTAVNLGNIFFIHIYLCVVGQRPSVVWHITNTIFIVFSRSGTGPAVFETWVVQLVLGTRGRVLHQLSFCLLPLPSEWCDGLALRRGWRLVSSFENSWPVVTACSYKRLEWNCFIQSSR